MLKSFAAALLAASVIVSPVLAQGTVAKPSAPTTEMTKAPAMTVKAVKQVKHRKYIKAANTSKAVKHVRVAPRHGRHHVKHVAVKQATAKPMPATTGSAPKAQ